MWLYPKIKTINKYNKTYEILIKVSKRERECGKELFNIELYLALITR